MHPSKTVIVFGLIQVDRSSARYFSGGLFYCVISIQTNASRSKSKGNPKAPPVFFGAIYNDLSPPKPEFSQETWHLASNSPKGNVLFSDKQPDKSGISYDWEIYQESIYVLGSKLPLVPCSWRQSFFTNSRGLYTYCKNSLLKGIYFEVVRDF